MQFKISSEFGPLKAVLIHRPGKAIQKINPENMEHYLFDDIPFLNWAQQEHDSFAGKLSCLGATVYRLDQLLEETIGSLKKKQTSQLKAFLKESLGSINPLCEYIAEKLLNLKDREISNVLLEGLTTDEWNKINGDQTGPCPTSTMILDPLPNSYFSRDPAAIINDNYVAGRFQFAGRRRESVLTQLIFKNHPQFCQNHFLDWATGDSKDSPLDDPVKQGFTLEGGDILVINSQAIMVGRGQRTSSKAVKEIAAQLRKVTPTERTYEIQLPAKRAYMHLDTVFTIIDRDLVLVHTPVMLSSRLKILRYDQENPDGIRVSTFEEMIKTEMPNVKFVETAGGTEHAHREQWTDGTNVFCLAPRNVIAYSHNPETNRALVQAGVHVLELEGRELVRGRGGPRCMTMPIYREEI